MWDRTVVWFVYTPILQVYYNQSGKQLSYGPWFVLRDNAKTGQAIPKTAATVLETKHPQSLSVKTGWWYTHLLNGDCSVGNNATLNYKVYACFALIFQVMQNSVWSL